MKHHKGELNKLLEYLSENPIISYACKKSGIGKSTFYRWYNNGDTRFRNAIDEAIQRGRDQWVDIAESVLIKGVKDGDMSAVRYFLSHNSGRYIPKRTLYVEPPTQKEIRHYRELLKIKPGREDNLTPEQAAEVEQALNYVYRYKKNKQNLDDQTT